MRLEGKVAVIVGAGQSPGEGIGNGRATTLRFAHELTIKRNDARILLQANGASFVDQAYVDAYRRFLDDTQDPILGRITILSARFTDAPHLFYRVQ